MRSWIIAGFLLVGVHGQNAFAQAEERSEENNEIKPRHRIAIIIGHTHIPKGVSGSENQSKLIVPSWGLNYEFWFNERWGIGSHNDMDISIYSVETDDGIMVERSRPIILTLVGLFKPYRYLKFLLGFGREFETHENFYVIRAGIELEFEISNNWDLSPGLIYNLKEDIYDSWTIGVGIVKRF